MKTRLFFFSSLLAVFLFAFAWMFVTTRTFAAGIYQGGTTGNDISYPQCSTSSYPSTAAFGIVGVTGGRAFTHNSCFSSEYAWAAALMYPSSV
jgi:hypothetical protein